MSRLEIILLSILFLSTIFNIGIFLYARTAILKLLTVSEELGDLQQMTQAFANHLESVYSLETFYGDQTLGSLLEHAASFNEQLETFEEIYSLTQQEELPAEDE
jgi:hypothetical protein|tara:strand:+ start:1041 stop:1352 length:312 start_codon:yes stop_codon:yes gene_type:complete